MAHPKKSERVLKMSENFMSLREQGMSISEIADKFSLHFTTVYDELDSISKANGVSRDSLLDRPHVCHSSPIGKKKQTKAKELINIEETALAFEKTLMDIDTILKNIDQFLEKEQEITKWYLHLKTLL